MDVIVEGKINKDESMTDILRTCSEIPSIKTPILRINDSKSDVQGRIAFSQGGYILGAKVTPSGEQGWAAIRRLVEIQDGNYAVLDPMRKRVTELNQSLWIKTDKLLALMPNLPDDPSSLIDPQESESVSDTLRPRDVSSNGEQTLILKKEKSKSRQYNAGAWSFMRMLVFVILLGALGFGYVTYKEQIHSSVQTILHR